MIWQKGSARHWRVVLAVRMIITAKAACAWRLDGFQSWCSYPTLKVVALKEDDPAFVKDPVTCLTGPRDPTPARAFLGSV